MTEFNVLIIEDINKKFDETLEILLAFSKENKIKMNHSRALNIIDAEEALETKKWDLILLDISMNISGSSTSSLDGNQADLGGLELAETMYMLRMEIPTIMITGFDYFKIQDSTDVSNSFLYLDQLKAKVSNFLGENLLGTVRHGNENWQSELSTALSKWKSTISINP